jgi:hypothetical protein
MHAISRLVIKSIPLVNALLINLVDLETGNFAKAVKTEFEKVKIVI